MTGLAASRLVVLTDRSQTARPLPETIAAAVDGGARIVVLREHDLPLGERLILAGHLAHLLRKAGGQLIIGAAALPGLRIPAGRQLTSTEPWPARRAGAGFGSTPVPLGRSCHSVADVVEAASRGADYVTLSPVFASRSKPGYGPPLTPAVFTATSAVPVRVYALGGIEDQRRAGECVAAGAYGVAAMGAVMRAADPAAVVSALLRAMGEMETP